MNPKWDRSAVNFPYPVIHFYLWEHHGCGMKGEIGLAGLANFSSRLAVVFSFPDEVSFTFVVYSQVHFSEARRAHRAETHHPSSCVSPETFQVYCGVNKTSRKDRLLTARRQRYNVTILFSLARVDGIYLRRNVYRAEIYSLTYHR